MSAPQTNIEKQKRRHSPALIGMGIAAVVVFLVVLLVVPQDLNEEDDAAATQGAAAETATN